MAIVFHLLLMGIFLATAKEQDNKSGYPNFTPDEVTLPEKYVAEENIEHDTNTTTAKLQQLRDSNTNQSYDGGDSISATQTTPQYIVPYNAETLPRCPEKMRFIEGFCFLITEPTTFPPICPYPINIEYFDLKNQSNLELTDETVWAFAMKTTEHFQWLNFMTMTSTENRIIPNKYIDNYENGTNEHCLVLNGTRLIPKRCDEKYRGICIYKPEIPRFADYCKSHYNDTCIGDNLRSITKCYCRSDAEWKGKGRSAFCQNLATINEPFQNFLIEQNVLNGVCWIEFYKNFTRAYNRSSSNYHPYSYTYWSSHTNFEKSFGALGWDGWSLEDDYVLNCAVCEIDLKIGPQPELHLMHNKSTHVIQLEIEHTSSLLNGIVCFTNNNVTFINITENDPQSIKTDIWNITDMSQYCWCRIIQKHSLKYVYSNTIVISNITIVTNENLTQRSVCLPSITTSGSMTLHWPETPLGTTAIPDELCLQEDGSPVTRSCGGELTFAANWLAVSGTCADVSFSERTLELDKLLRSEDIEADVLTRNLLHITQDTSNVTTYEVHLVSKVLEKVAFSEQTDMKIVTDVISTISNIMHFGPNNLRGAQELLNSTDILLCSLDDVLTRVDVGTNGYASEVSEKILIQMSDIEKTKITGIKLHPPQSQGFDISETEFLKQGQSQEELLKENLELAMVTPPELYNDILNCPGSKLSPNIITTVFYDDVLFNEKENKTGQTEGRIISVLIPGFNCSFTAPLQVIFKSSQNSSADIKCASWKYGSDNMENIHGQWSVESEPKSVENSNYKVCEFRHVTHFSLLIMGPNTNISEGHKKALDIITAVGSGLSILGLLAIFLTAIVFKSYRSANGVVINFSVAMTAQIVLLFIADNVGENGVICTIFGAALHYIVLSQFCWMLTIGILQYKRYVLIFSSPTTHLVAKSCVFSWGVPLIPIIVIVSISTDNYGPNSYGLCYALGNYFIFGVLLPVSLIVFFNLLIFLRIMISIASSRRITVHQKKDDTSILQLRLAFLLYFLLGLTWGFGLLAAIGGGIAYSYLFCLTATLQGFVLFLYFIVLNEKTRSLWFNMKSCCCKCGSDKYDVSGDSSATAMVRRPKHATDTRSTSASSDMLRRIRDRNSSDF